MSAFHGLPVVSGVFDDPNLVSCAGLVPLLGLARRCGLGQLLRARLTVSGPGAADPAGKTLAVLAGMLAGADSIDDLGLLRHGGLPRLLQVWAPSTLGSFLRRFRFGHVRQLDAVAGRLLPRLAQAVPLLPGVGEVAFLDLDDTIREVHGYQKQGAGFGYSGVRGLNALLATVSTPLAAPVIAAARLRKGSVNSARGARRLLTDALVVARRSGATGLVIVRADSAYYVRDVIAAATTAGARFSVTARLNPAVHTAIAAIPDTAWTPIHYPEAVFDDEEQRWISDAEVAETEFTAFTSKPKADRVTARLIVRRVRRLGANPGQGELFTGHRYHAIFTDSPLPLVDADICHRKHAIIEQVIADLKASALAHLPSGKFTANAAWLALATISFNLTRAGGCAAGGPHSRASTPTLRRRLITVPARIASSARRLILHLPQHWPWQDTWQTLFTSSTAPPVLR
jgi:hypothetical protein